MHLFACPTHSCCLMLTIIFVCVYLGLSSEINEEVVEEQPWLWDDLKYSRELGKLESLLSNTLPADKEAPTIGDWRNNSELEVDEGLLTSSAPRPNEIINNHQQESQHRSKSAQEEADDDDDDEDDEEEEDKMNDVIYEADARSIAATEEKSSSHLPLHKPKPQKRRLFDTRTTHFPVFRYRNGNAQPRVLPLLGSHAALSKIQRESAQFMAKVLRRYARRQSKKRSPNCMRKCIAQGLLHPAQCHSLC